MNIIDRCIAFCTSLDPDFPRRLRGSTPEQIAALEQAMGRPLGEAHRAFLERMGEETGTLDLGPYTTSPRALVERRKDELSAPPEGMELFAAALADDEDVFLREGEDPEVVRHEDDETDAVAGSLSELICLPIFNARRAVVLPLQGMYTEKEMRSDTLSRCRRIGELFGFEPLWFSNAHTYAATRGSLVVVAKQAPESYFSVGVAGDDEFAWGVVTRTLFRELDLEPYR